MTTTKYRILTLLALLLVIVPLTSCGSDDSEGTETCEPGFAINPITDACEPLRFADPEDAGGLNNASTSADAGIEDGGQAPDASEEDTSTGCIDMDDDGDCADVDCNDDNPAVGPSKPEICDRFDNDCNNEVNDTVECAFYAHSNEALYLVDPFALTLEEVAPTPTTLLDMDTHPDGRLFAILETNYLAVFDEMSQRWVPRANSLGLIGNANGLAISNTGRVFITSSGSLYTADLETGVASEIGSYSPYVSSGDAVVSKGDNLLMTSSHVTPDALVRLDGQTGGGTPRGSTGVDGIWGLTSAFGTLYGLTSSGELVELDEETGLGMVLHTFPDVSFFGAASTPGR